MVERVSEETSTAPLLEVIGRNVRAVRAHYRLRQDDVASAAARRGIPWGRSTVSQIEGGSKQLRAHELIALPAIMTDAVLAAGGPGDEPVALGMLLDPGDGLVEVSSGLQLNAEEVIYLFGESIGAVPIPDGVDAPPTEAERRAAAQLEISADALVARSLELWGRRLEAERDARLPDDWFVPKTAPAARGHVTRALIGELRRKA